MNCPSCGTAAPPRNRFCTQCGAALPVPCPSCGQPNDPAARFCGSCGTALAATAQAAVPSPTTERRHLTLMFCDLADSTALSRKLDPEDLAQVINAYQSHCADCIQQFEGTVARFLGDGILVYFGYPKAHEDDAERAVRAALKIVGEIGRVAPLGVELRVRIGIASGLVVIRDLVGVATVPELEAIGSTPNLAARLQAITAANSVVVADSTRRLIGGLFNCTDLGLHEFKGFAEPVRAWRVDGESVSDSRFGAFHGGRFTPLIGREREMNALLSRWDEAKSGRGQAIFVSSDPGIGKSRLLHEFRASLAREPHRFIGLACSPFYQNSALYPVAVELARLAQIEAADSPAAKLNKLAAAAAAVPGAETLPLLAALLSIPTDDRFPALELSPVRRKQRTLEVLVALIAALAADRPIIVEVEDAHWIDPTSQDLIGALLAAIKTRCVLVIVAFRPEFKPPWRGAVPVSAISLSRLTRDHAAALVAQLTRQHALPARTIDDVLDKTDGVPLFIEELTKTVLEAGAVPDGGASVALSVPSTLQASLTARLDRLAAAKEVAQIGAVIGRSFPFRLLAAISSLNEATLRGLLDRLVHAELVFASGHGADATYTFKHALVQDASYETLLLSKRRRLHAAIARALETQFPDQAGREPELVAHHFTRAGQPLDAISYWLKAGQRAMARSTASEAIAQLNRGLDLVKQLPDGAERDAHELDLRLALGQVFISIRGHAAVEVGEAFARVRELCSTAGDGPRLTMVLMGLVSFHQVRGELRAAIGFAEDLLRHIENQPEPAARALGHRGIAVPLLYLGKFVPALEHLERGLALYDPKQRQSRNFQLVNDPRVASWSLMSGALVRLGFIDKARERSRAALAEARALHQPFDLAGALHHACFLNMLCLDDRVVAEIATTLVKLSRDQTFPNYVATGTIFHGWASAVSGNAAEGIEQMLRGIEAYRATGAAINLPSWLGLLAEGYQRAGDSGQASRLVDDALRLVEATGERGYESHLVRLAGEIARDAGDVKQAELHFNRALAVAREQQARLFELRAAASLARLWREQGKGVASKDVLAGVVAWFQEGRDVPDLSDARDLLAALA
jgi:class 3 adenylate cyclase/predicted ATPase